MRALKPMAGALLVLGLGLSPAVRAGTILFDPDGPGPLPAMLARAFDVAPGNALADNSVPVVDGASFQLLYQARMSAVFSPTGLNISPGLGTTFELTVVASFPEKATTSPVDPTRVDFSLGVGQTNFFQMYFQPAVNSNDATGAGFNDGTLVLEGFVSGIGGASFSLDTPQPVPLPPLADNNSTPTVAGTGSQRDIVVTITSFDPAFWPNGAPLSLNFRTQSDTPFTTADASAAFFDGTVPNLGAVNGMTGPDFQFQTDASFTVTPIPEPSTLALIGFGLGFVGVTRAIRRRLGSAA